MQHGTGTIVEVSLQSNTVTVRKDIRTDELLVNRHKLNPQIYQLSDMRQIGNDPLKAIGNLTMMGTVLVKAWEPHLNKYVLIRRQIRTPIFSTLLNLPVVPAGLDIESDVMKEFLTVLGQQEGNNAVAESSNVASAKASSTSNNK
jgi:hypothetical protein